MKLSTVLVVAAVAALVLGGAGCKDCKCSMKAEKSCSARESCPHGDGCKMACKGQACQSRTACGNSDGCGKCKAGHAASADKPVNAKCPMMGLAVSKSIETRKFEGKTVGFCCAGCPTAWDKLSDAEKRQKLDAAGK